MKSMPALDRAQLPAHLRDAGRAGVRSLAQAQLPAVREAALSLGFRACTIHLEGCADKHAVLARFTQALSFPDWFGDNWDALADALGDLGWLPESDGYVLMLLGHEAFERADHDGYATLVGILDAVSRSWAQIEVPFWAFACAGHAATR